MSLHYSNFSGSILLLCNILAHLFLSKYLLTLTVSFHYRRLVLHLRGGGQEKKRPRDNISSSRRSIPDGDDPMDSV
jgi:hypothetical protein